MTAGSGANIISTSAMRRNIIGHAGNSVGADRHRSGLQRIHTVGKRTPAIIPFLRKNSFAIGFIIYHINGAGACMT